MINLFLYGQPVPPKVIADAPASPVVVSLGDVQSRASGQMAIPVRLESDGSIAGLQASLTFDPDRVAFGTPYLVDRAAGLTVQAQVSGGTLRLVAYSMDGQVIPAGTGVIVLVPVKLLDGRAVSTVTLTDVVLADRQGQTIRVQMGSSAVKVSSIPTAFALQNAVPNPFNPSTTIAYEVPQAGHITLAVYNLLGQEVVRLVDTTQAPGRYTVVWNARNAQGVPVANGVYLYRLTSSTGFSETKRMTLLK